MNLARTNTLAYLTAMSATKKESFDKTATWSQSLKTFYFVADIAK
jgi:hypothetical protein